MSRELLLALDLGTTSVRALLAGLAVGVFASPEACRSLLAPPERFEPAWGDEERSAARDRWRRTLARARS